MAKSRSARRRAARRRRQQTAMTPTRQDTSNEQCTWEYHGWEKFDDHTTIKCVSDVMHDIHDRPAITIVKVDHADRAMHAWERGGWVNRYCQVVSPLPWENENMPDYCELHVPLVRDTETRRLARTALIAVYRRLVSHVTDDTQKLFRLARVLISACQCGTSLEDEYRKMSLLIVAHNEGWNTLTDPDEWHTFAQHLFDSIPSQ